MKTSVSRTSLGKAALALILHHHFISESSGVWCASSSNSSPQIISGNSHIAYISNPSPFTSRLFATARQTKCQSCGFLCQERLCTDSTRLRFRRKYNAHNVIKHTILKQQKDFFENENYEPRNVISVVNSSNEGVKVNPTEETNDKNRGTNVDTDVDKSDKYMGSEHNVKSIDSSRSTFNPEYEGGTNGNRFAAGRNERRNRLHAELTNLGIDPTEIESHPDRFGTAAIRTYNSFLLPKSKGALAVTESPTRPRVVANSISFLTREFKADSEKWLRNVDKNRGADATDNADLVGDANNVETRQPSRKHPITIILDNIRSAHNVGNILRLAEASQVDSVRLCGMTPRPPHPKVLKTAMGSAEYVSLGEDHSSTTSPSTLQTVLDLKEKGVKVYGVETTENATTLWDTPIPDEHDSIAFVFGNEIIGVGT